MKHHLTLTVAAILVLQAFGVSQDTATNSARAAIFSVIHVFKNPKNGLGPGTINQDSAGNLFGMTGSGGDLNCDLTGSLGCGVVFKLNTAGKETVLHRFDGSQADEGTPSGGLIRDADGNLYGTTSGIALYCGTVFKVDKTGKETVLYRFTCGTDGGIPLAGLVRDSAGNLYGTASGGGIGGPSGQGVVFKVDVNGKETVLYSFTGGPDGGSPMAGLVRDAAGNLYGTTASGGAFGSGVVFKLDTSGDETVLHAFTGKADGATPQAGLVRDPAGNLYGTTLNGGDLTCNLNGSPGCGVVFKLNTSGKLAVRYAFKGRADGGVPSADLVQDAAGNLYGASGFGGNLNDCSGQGCGVLFKLDPHGKEIVLHTFTGGLDGGAPDGVLLDATGNLYGSAAIGGGNQGVGVVFKITQ
jgi:uncharacterized repeat protein (TIGR03803 family)